jgi:SRSO17 transposase
VVIIQTEALPIRPLCACIWDAAPVEMEVLLQADRLVGGSDAALVIDDTAIPKKGTHSVGVASQYASALQPPVDWSAAQYVCFAPKAAVGHQLRICR